MKKNNLYFIIVALLILNLSTFSKLKNLENNMNNRFQQSDFVTNGLRNDINNIYSNVDTMLKMQGSILDKYSITFGELNPSNFTIPVTLTLTPKVYSKRLIASLQLNDKSALMKDNGTSFQATVDTYIFDDFQLKVGLEENGVKKIETIEEYHDLRSEYLLDINSGFSGQSRYSGNEYQYSGKIDLQFGKSQANSVEKISIVNDVNGVTVSERKLDPSSASIDVKEKIKLSTGEKFTMYAKAQDRYGLNYKYIIDVYEVTSNQKRVMESDLWEKRRLVEITDRNWKVLYSPKYNMVK